MHPPSEGDEVGGGGLFSDVGHGEEEMGGGREKAVEYKKRTEPGRRRSRSEQVTAYPARIPQ